MEAKLSARESGSEQLQALQDENRALTQAVAARDEELQRLQAQPVSTGSQDG